MTHSTSFRRPMKHSTHVVPSFPRDRLSCPVSSPTSPPLVSISVFSQPAYLPSSILSTFPARALHAAPALPTFSTRAALPYSLSRPAPSRLPRRRRARPFGDLILCGRDATPKLWSHGHERLHSGAGAKRGNGAPATAAGTTQVLTVVQRIRRRRTGRGTLSAGPFIRRLDAEASPGANFGGRAVQVEILKLL